MLEGAVFRNVGFNTALTLLNTQEDFRMCIRRENQDLHAQS
jgi:hypothetical protein